MKRYLNFFEPDTRGSREGLLERAFEAGGRKALMIGTEACDEAMSNALEKTGFSWFEKQMATFQKSDIAEADALVVSNGNPMGISRVLHACIGEDIAVIAPVTAHHYSRRTVFLMSIPKAGTHMVIRLFDLMGLARSPDRAPRPGTWSTPVGYAYHAPCRELMANNSFDPIGRQLLFRSPAIFVYRNPLDIAVSELDWFLRPEHVFSGYLSSCADESEQLARLIADDTVMGNIRDRVNRYAGWMHFSNVIPLSYEELVGSRGGGSDIEQLDAIWALQLKLHIPGSPKEYGARVYDPTSATFSKGRIGRHMECFKKYHFKLVDSLSQDFMQALGYVRGSKISSKVMALRQRPLVVKELPPDILYTPRLVREGIMGWNIIESAGKYFPVRQGEHIMSAVDAEKVLSTQEGFVTLRDVIDAVMCDGGVTPVATEPHEATGTELVLEGYLGFNVVRHGGYWYGFDQAAGNIDIPGLGESTLEQLKRNGMCVVGRSYADVKTEILRLVIQTRERRESELSAPMTELMVRTKSQVDETLESLTRRVSALAPEINKESRLLEAGYRGFNLVAYDGKVWAVEMSTGPVDLRDAAIREPLLAEHRILEATTLNGARLAADICVLEECVRAIETRFDEVNALLTELKLDSKVAQGTARELAGLRSHLVETTASLEKLREESWQVVTQAKMDIQGRIDDVRNTDLARLHEKSQESVNRAKSALQEQIDEVKNNDLARLRAESQQAITQTRLDLQGRIDDVRNIDLARLHEESQQSVSQAKSKLEEQIGDLKQNTLVRAGSYITKKNKKGRKTHS